MGYVIMRNWMKSIIFIRKKQTNKKPTVLAIPRGGFPVVLTSWFANP